MASEALIRLKNIERQLAAQQKQLAYIVDILKRLPPAQEDKAAEAQHRRILGGLDEAEAVKRFCELTGEEPPAPEPASLAQARARLRGER